MSTASEPADAARKTLLVVDDIPENLAILGEILMPLYRVRVAGSGRRALEVAASAPRPDLVLLDVMMPEMDGYDVLRRLREDPHTADVPVIFVTALDTTEDEAHGLALGAADYIAKPVRPAIVLARVRCQLELKAARDRMRDQNAWLESEVARRMHQNQIVQDVSLRALAALAEVRDEETGNHILRTQAYVQSLAQTLSATDKYAHFLTPERIAAYTKAAPLHDIGKVAIPDHILRKPGRHTPEEWEIMKTHAAVGAESIRRAIGEQAEDRETLDFLYTAMDIARHHHERWDGSGYPDGLAGDAIPLSARLMALADVFDALISKRAYKPAMSLEQARDIIVAGRGNHFDPDIVDAYLASMDRFADIARRHRDPPAAMPPCAVSG